MHAFLFLLAPVALTFFSHAAAQLLSSESQPRFLAEDFAAARCAVAENSISPHFTGIVKSTSCSQMIVIDSGASNTFTGGTITGSGNCTVVLNVAGNSNTITSPSFFCSGNAVIHVNILGNSNVLTGLTLNGAGKAQL